MNFRDGVSGGIAGAMVGFLVWFVTAWILDLVGPPADPNGVFFAGVLIGLLPLSAILGFVLVLVGAARGGSIATALTTDVLYSLAGLGCGLLLGGAAGFLGEFVFSLAKNARHELLGRVAGALVFGVGLGIAVGVAELARTRAFSRLFSAALGGLIAGPVAGLVFHGFGMLFRDPNVQALSYTFLAGSIGLAVGLVTQARSVAVLIGMRERRPFP